MRRSLRLVLAGLVIIVLPACWSVPGTVKLVLNQSGAWEAVEVVTPSDGITPGDLRDLEDFLNGK